MEKERGRERDIINQLISQKLSERHFRDVLPNIEILLRVYLTDD